MSEDREMRLGYPGMAVQQLDSYQRHVIGERIYGYCVYPNDELERRRYQLSLSFFRTRQLDAKHPTPDLYDLKVTAHQRRKYLAEEAAFFEQEGDVDEFINSRGREFYIDRIIDLVRVAWAVGLMNMGLAQAKNSGLRPSQKLALRILESDQKRLEREIGELIKPEKVNPGRMQFQPKLGTLMARRGPPNEKYAADMWREYHAVLPLLTATMFVLGSHKVENTPVNWITFGHKAEYFIVMALTFEKFLSETYPPPGKKPLVDRSVFWRLPRELVGSLKAGGIESTGALPSSVVI